MEVYKMLVRPEQEYCVQLWSSHYRKDVIALETVERRFTRMLPGLESFSYAERLVRLGFFYLRAETAGAGVGAVVVLGSAFRCGILTDMYKIMWHIDRKKLFPFSRGVNNQRGVDLR